ncbi:MAG: cysteine-rich CWC family protein [Pseudomonadota bacterium]
MTNPLADSMQAKTRALTCPRCGTAFSCDLDGTCWCAAETAKLPMPADGEDCLCVNCLREAANRGAASSR